MHAMRTGQQLGSVVDHEKAGFIVSTASSSGVHELKDARARSAGESPPIHHNVGRHLLTLIRKAGAVCAAEPSRQTDGRQLG